MTDKTLASYFQLHRRYYRSVNLERDLDKPDAVQGYVPTERSADALRRILSALANPKAHRAWTMTGVYGTGKSAFAHYLASLCAPESSQIRQESLAIAQHSFGAESPEVKTIEVSLPQQGLFRAVATGQREPLSWTLARALANGADIWWQGKRKPEVVRDLTDWRAEVEEGKAQITGQQILSALREIVQIAKVNVFLIIDELGKNLEFAAHNQGVEDLYLLQQIAELHLKNEPQVYFLGLLHQSFAGYSDRLAAVEQSEWSKIQGRFEDIAFTESPSQMTRLIGQAINRTPVKPVAKVIQLQAGAWLKALQGVVADNEVSEKVLADAYPLHPLTALVLPNLCVRYAQNDRSLFTFLTSDEPYAFHQFLNSNKVEDDTIPTLKLYQVYDYFVESVTGLTSRINLQRWVEIQDLIQDARDRSLDTLQVLKTIGILNLATSTGALRATPELVALALCDRPNSKEQQHWHQIIQELQEKGIITYRSQLNELRIWEGSDFNVEVAIRDLLEKERLSLADLLTAVRPLKPLVAQRHYTITGTLRYFEQRYVDSLTKLSQLKCVTPNYDGLIAYWVDSAIPSQIPPRTIDGKPLVLITTAKLNLLTVRAQEFRALKKIQREAPELQTDGVARKEVKHRLVEAERLLDETLAQAFAWLDEQNSCWVAGQQTAIKCAKAFQTELSNLCDRIYNRSLILDNEFINRRELTSQGAKARRELLEAMLERGSQERLGLEGYGPEVAIYYSVLEATGIHRQEDNEWGFHPPHSSSGLAVAWQAIEEFCLGAKDKIQTLDHLYTYLEAPPYGIKRGAIPVLIAAILIYHFDDISVYKDGTFIPVLSSEHFELLVKDPARYGVKHIEITGLRAQVFQELESVLRSAGARNQKGVRNLTLLSVVKPLFQFVKRLPAYTLKTKRLGFEAQAVLRTLLQAQEPDDLVFRALPEACGLPAITTHESDDGKTAKTLRKKLVQSLQEIQNAYEKLLSECQTLLHSAFGVRSEEKLREDLRVRARYLVDQCIDPLLRRFTLAAIEENTSDQEWLEALAMIIGDKPAESWSDEDATAFELKVSDLARRFKNLEALRTEVAASNPEGFEARRITITRPDGKETHRMVWLDNKQQNRINDLVEEFLGKLTLYDDPQLQQALVAKLAERVLGADSQQDVSQLQTKQKSRQHGKEKGQTHSRAVRRQR